MKQIPHPSFSSAIIFALLIFAQTLLPAQNDRSQTPLEEPGVKPVGAWAYVEIAGKDTTYIMSLATVRISDKYNFKSSDDQKQYLRYARAARNVYAYALQAVDLYQTIQEETEGMGRWKRKRHIRREHRELKEDFSEKLKKLSKTEGKVLIKMIESQVDKPFYDIVRETRGGGTAFYWNTMGKMYGYDLKNGYQKGEDPLLDAVLLDYDFGRPDWYGPGW